jgi:hypothetical protein
MKKIAAVLLFLWLPALPAGAAEAKENLLEPGPGRIVQIGPEGAGYVVVKNPDGTKFLVLTDNENKYLPGRVKPVEVGRTPAFEGFLRRIGELEAPEEQLPPALREPPPHLAEGETVTDEYRGRAKKRAALERRWRWRWVVDTRLEKGQETYDAEDLYDGDGVLLKSVREITSRAVPGAEKAAA